MNFEEIKESLERQNITASHLGDIYPHEDINEVGKVKWITTSNGTSDWQDTEIVTLHFVDHDVYVQISGYSSSYSYDSGIEWFPDIVEVKKKESSVTSFERVGS